MTSTIRLTAIGVLLALGACTSADQDGTSMTSDQRAAAWASVDPVRDCTKPWFDTVSATDRRTVIKGMTLIERQVCSEKLRTDTNQR